MKWRRYETQLETVPPERRDSAKDYAERLVTHGHSPDTAVTKSLRRFGPAYDEVPAEVESADVSLAHPHGPEGESHGGRGGRDPLRFVEDSTPAGTNAFSRTRGSPRRSRTARRRRR